MLPDSLDRRISDELRPKTDKASEFNRFLTLLKFVLKKVFRIALDSDILHIVRPFIFVYLVMKHGRKSWLPLQVSFTMDLLIILLLTLKLIG